MKRNKCFVAILATLFMAIAITATARERKAPKMYVFGISTSFNDSTAYFTTIQEIDSVTTVGKTRIMSNKQEYSYQLRNHFANKGMASRTCITINAKDRKKIGKTYAKMKIKLAKKQKYIIKDIDDAEFRYERVTMAQ